MQRHLETMITHQLFVMIRKVWDFEGYWVTNKRWQSKVKPRHEKQGLMRKINCQWSKICRYQTLITEKIKHPLLKQNKSKRGGDQRGIRTKSRPKDLYCLIISFSESIEFTCGKNLYLSMKRMMKKMMERILRVWNKKKMKWRMMNSSAVGT